MSYCREEGKDRIIFVTEEDHKEPSKIELSADDDDYDRGLILESGGINWECPCLGGMATGPCGVEFREAFSCFYYSKEEPKGSDCYEAFHTMTQCMSNYPSVYGDSDDRDVMSEAVQQSSDEDVQQSSDEAVQRGSDDIIGQDSDKTSQQSTDKPS